MACNAVVHREFASCAGKFNRLNSRGQDLAFQETEHMVVFILRFVFLYNNTLSLIIFEIYYSVSFLFWVLKNYIRKSTLWMSCEGHTWRVEAETNENFLYPNYSLSSSNTMCLPPSSYSCIRKGRNASQTALFLARKEVLCVGTFYSPQTICM